MNGNATVRDLFELCDSDGKGYVSRTSICSLAQFLPFSVDQLEAVFDSLDVDHNGQLTFEEFSDGFSMMITDEPPETSEVPRAQRKHRTIRDIQRSAQSDARAKAREYFELCDAERKQYVTRDDIMRLDRQLGLAPDQLHLVFDSLDADRKGFLTLDDFTDGISNFLLQSDASPQFAERQSLEAETPDATHQAGANSNPSSLLASLLDVNVDK